MYFSLIHAARILKGTNLRITRGVVGATLQLAFEMYRNNTTDLQGLFGM